MLAVTSLPGERLKGIRQRMGLSVVELAMQSGVPAAEIAALEESGGEEMTARQMRALCLPLSVPMNYWIVPDAHDYMVTHAEASKRSLHNAANLGQQLVWAWKEQQRAWGDLFSIRVISDRLGLSSIADMAALFESPESAAASPLATLLMSDLGLPPHGDEETLAMYHAPVLLAASRGITPQQLTQIVVQGLRASSTETKRLQ